MNLHWIRSCWQQASLPKGKPERFVYWPLRNSDVGVGFADPGCWELDEYGVMRHVAPAVLMEGDISVVKISEQSHIDLGRKLFSLKDNLFSEYREVWRETVDDSGNQMDPLLLWWIRYHIQEESCEMMRDDNGDRISYAKSLPRIVIDECVYNDYTNLAFDYVYIKRILECEEIGAEIDLHSHYTDGCRVSRRFGYDSPSYAVALYLSLKYHDLLGAAMSSFDSFVRYHPFDSISAMCERDFERRFSLAMLSNAKSVEKELEEELYPDCLDDDIGSYGTKDDYDDAYDPVYYVNDEPVYDAGSQEEAEEIYWNTH